VQRALDLEDVGLELAFREERLFVGADIRDRVDVRAHAIEADGLTVSDELTHAAVRDLVDLRDRLEVRHQTATSSCC
jgi:hypothetical protein